jgi:hypothetical protein
MKVASGILAAYSIIIGSGASITSAAAFPPLKGQHQHDERDLVLALGGRDLKEKKSNVRRKKKKKSTLTWKSGNTYPSISEYLTHMITYACPR